MPRYFLELSYKGTAYSGFQIQDNAHTVQAEVQNALQTLFRIPFELTGSSRTDAGVHANQNFFHFDTALEIKSKIVYNLNALVPEDISIKAIYPVPDMAHCRFDAVSREYQYFIYKEKDPFLNDRAWRFPYPVDMNILQEAAQVIARYSDFTSFSKRNTQVKTFICAIESSEWVQEGSILVYKVKANRFLRGMVRGLVGTMLRVGTGKLTMDQFKTIIDSRESRLTDFSVPPHGLSLQRIHYPVGYWQEFDEALV